MKDNIPNEGQVRLIFRETYNLYTKHKGICRREDFEILMQEVIELNNKHNCNLCLKILLEIVDCIEYYFMKHQA